MKRIILLIVSSILLQSESVFGQNSVKNFNPPVVSIELSGYEPKPPGVSDILLFGGGGAGSDPAKKKVGKPYWQRVPTTAEFLFTSLQACGYLNGQPNATLILPSGKQQPLQSQYKMDDCLTYSPSLTIGSEFGLYTLRLEHGNSVLSHSWRMDYPTSPVAVELSGFEASPQVITLAGFAPRQKLRAHFYKWKYADKSPYIATREIQMDDNGAIILSLSASRSATFKAHEIHVLIDDYIREDKGNYSNGNNPSSNWKYHKITTCAGQLPSRLYVGAKTLITPGDANRVRNSPNGEVIGTVKPGDDFIITDGPRCDTKFIAWWKIQLLNTGLTGWTAEGQGKEYWIVQPPQ